MNGTPTMNTDDLDRIAEVFGLELFELLALSSAAGERAA